MKKTISYILKITLPLLLGGAILYWMYRGFDFSQLSSVLDEMDWSWMLLSLPFGVLAQVFRGLRWRQTLDPLGEHARTSTAIYAIFISYASSLVVPRIGEFARCGVLKRYDDVSFPKALGTVVTERAVDTIVMLVATAVALLVNMPVFTTFFSRTGTRLDTFFGQFTTTGYIVTLICGLAALLLVFLLVRKMTIYNKVKDVVRNLWQGVISLRHVNNVWLYLFFTVAIWFSYFFHFSLTFKCFEATSSLGFDAAIVSFVVGSIAVIVPTPNGAGPWHFAVKTMLILYGVESNAALFFVLIVHTIQTFLVVILGIVGGICVKRKGEGDSEVKEVKADTSLSNT
ncbi:MAG: flippase-like domain-containing protein [Prevotella sp.]|nr:flippase-like domain-containing protein [Prevotella sp.]